MPGNSSSLAGDWQRDHPAWLAGNDEFFTGLEQTELKVLSWGPGPMAAKSYEKRASIIESLSENPNNEVTTLEELSKADPRLIEEIDVYEAGELLASLADIIICLLVDDTKATGAPGEVLQFRADSNIRDKVRLIRPRKPGKGYLLGAGEVIEDKYSFPYTLAQFKDCQNIRGKCHSWVAAVRKEKFLRRWRAVQKSAP